MLSIQENAKTFTNDNNIERFDEAVLKVPGVLSFNWGTLPYLASVLSRFQAKDPDRKSVV